MPTTGGVTWLDYIDKLDDDFGDDQQIFAQYAQLNTNIGNVPAVQVKAFKVAMLGDVSITAGGVSSVLMLSGGASYAPAPTVTFSAPPSGVTATGTANLGSGSTAGQVVSVTITNPGSGYTTGPTVTFAGGGGGGGAIAIAAVNATLNRTAPTANARYPWLYCNSVRLAQMNGAPYPDATDGVVLYPQQIYRCEFRNLFYNPVSDPVVSYLERRFDFQHEAVQTGPPAYQWAASASTPNQPIAVPGNLIMGLANLSYTWHNVPVSSNYEAIQLAPNFGLVNAAPFDNRWPTASLLFLGAKREPHRFTASGQMITNYTLLVSYRAAGWQKFFNRVSGSFEPIVRKAGALVGQPPYGTVQYSQLFTWVG